MRAPLAALLVVACSGAPLPPAPVEPPRAPARVLDDFEELSPWRASASEAATAAVAARPGRAGSALRLTFDLAGTSGYAVARRSLSLDLSGGFELSFALRGELLRNNFELKFVDASGENVWWFHRRDFEISPTWRSVRVRREQIEFAWGPTAHRTLGQIAAVEVVISAGQGGGAGWIELDELTLRPRPLPGPAPRPSATAVRAGKQVADAAALAAVFDGQVGTAWRGGAEPVVLEVELGRERELAGLVLSWQGAPPKSYRVAVAGEGPGYAAPVEVRSGGLDVVPLGKAARRLRLELPPDVALAEVVAVDAPPDDRREPLLAAAASVARRGALPRAYHGEQPYWTVVGVDGGRASGLLSEDGALELYPGGPSLEPALAVASTAAEAAVARAATWADVALTHSLVDRYLPMPRVTWAGPSWELQIAALAAGPANASELAVRYTLRNRGAASAAFELRLALRPLQVNPPTQFLNIAGGLSPLSELAWSPGDNLLLADGRPLVRPLVAPERVALLPTAQVAQALAPARSAATGPASLRDAGGLASAALSFPLTLAPGQEAVVVVTSPLGRGLTISDGELAPPPAPPVADGGAAWFEAAHEATRGRWHELLDGVTLEVPVTARPLVDTLRSSLAYLLISRDGPILRPGTRAYARAWIRDGAMISEALLRLGHPQVAAEFLRWFLPHLLPSGKVPCCVDAHGAVAVPEHDSHGQLAYLAHQVYRYGRDEGLARRAWPAVLAAMRYQRELRASERTPRNRAAERAALWGLLPPSISHEGYSAKPAYSYWDNFWGLRGLDDAALLAAALRQPEAAELAAERDQVAAELAASLRVSAASFGLGVIAGAADLGDFDPTSTTIALAPGVPASALPRELVLATFERAWRELSERSAGQRAWREYTPYELRLPGAFLRLGWRERAHAALAFYLAGRRPAPWNQWPEVLGVDPRAPRFLGDLPHAWVHSDYARTALDLFAYERDGALVLAAGVLPDWLDGAGVVVRDLPTPWGPLSYHLRRRAAGVELQWQVDAAPPGGMLVAWPPGAAPRSLGRRAGRVRLAESSSAPRPSP